MSANLYCLGSSSQGNAYIVEVENGDKLLIECGVDFFKILEKCNYEPEKIVACIVSHSHGDHSSSIPDAIKYGINVYSTAECANKFNGVKALKNVKAYDFKGFKVLPLEMEHNIDCFGFIISHNDFGTIAFFTDTKNIPYYIQHINTLMIEANYDKKIVDNAAEKGLPIKSHYDQHLSLDNCISAIKRFNNGDLNQVILLHLSPNFSDTRAFKEQIFNETGIKCEIAYENKYIFLSKAEF